MPDPRIRRPRPPGARQGRPPRTGAPDGTAEAPAETPTEAPLEPAAAAEVPALVEAPADAEHLEPDAAASAEAEAAALAADDVANGASEEASEEASAGEEPAVDPEAPEGTGDTPAEPDEEPVGWFRDEPLDEGAEAGEAAPPAAETPVGDEIEAGEVGEAVVRERDRPVVVPLPEAAPPRRGRRLRGILIGIVTIVAVAAVGFVAGLMLPTILPGPGVDSTPAPSVVASEAPTPSPVPTPEPTPTAAPTPTPTPTATPTPAPTQVVYVVKPGDQLARIAATYGVTVAAIQKANNIKDPNLIKVGQKLKIPLPEATPAP
jgi:LysM repeat protein